MSPPASKKSAKKGSARSRAAARTANGNETPGEASQDGAEAGDPVEGLSFEGALEKLETTVGQLEQGELPLEEALTLFEQGVALARRCTTTLEDAERRIEILTAETGDPERVTVDAFETDAFEDAFEEEDDED